MEVAAVGQGVRCRDKPLPATGAAAVEQTGQVQAKQRGQSARCLFQAGGLIAVGQRLAPLSKARTPPLKEETLENFSFGGDVLAPQVNVVVRRDRDESTLSLGGTCAGGVIVGDSRSARTGYSAGWEVKTLDCCVLPNNSPCAWNDMTWRGTLSFHQVRSLRASDQPSTMLVDRNRCIVPRETFAVVGHAQAIRQPECLMMRAS